MMTLTVGPPSPGATLLVAAGSGPTLISNSDPVNTVYLGNTPSFNVPTETVALNPTQFVAVDGQRDVYGETVSGQSALISVIPGGLSFFQLLRKLVIQAGTPNSGLFIYSGVPAFGDLIASGSAILETDQFTNVVQPGFTSYGPFGNPVASLEAGAVLFGIPAQFAGAGGAQPGQIGTVGPGRIDILSGIQSAADLQASISLQSQAVTGSIPQIVANDQIVTINGPILQNENWHTIGLAAGLTGALAGGIGLRVKQVPWNGVWIDCDVSAAAVGTFICGSLPNANYYPTAARHLALGVNGGSLARLFIPTSGALQIIVGGAGAWAGGLSTQYPID